MQGWRHYEMFTIITIICPFVSVCVYDCNAPFFRHDHRTATKFATHKRIDLGMIRI